MGLDRAAIESVGLSWQEAERYNGALERLRGRRLPSLTAENSGKDPIHNLRVLSQILLYRVVMLADGCCVAWNAHNPLAGALCGRALIETAAVVWDYQHQLSRLCRDRDRMGISELAFKRTFATKLPGGLLPKADIEATNILTLIDKMDPRKVVRDFYNLLSEFCHPNHMGHHILFAEVDITSPTMKLGEGVWRGRTQIVEPIFSSLTILDLVEGWLTEIDEQLPKVFSICHGPKATH